MMEEENRQLKEHIEYLEKANKYNSKFMNLLYAKNTFLVEIIKGVPRPKDHPDYYKGLINISINFSLDDSDTFYVYGSIQIEDKSYEVNEMKANAIKDIITSNFDKLLEITKNQTFDEYAGGCDGFRVKVGSIFMMLSSDNATTEEEYNFINNMEQEIINIAKK